jgi:hypothetical protein
MQTTTKQTQAHTTSIQLQGNCHVKTSVTMLKRQSKKVEKTKNGQQNITHKT